METSVLLVPVVTLCVFTVVLYQSVKYFITIDSMECADALTCKALGKRGVCRESDKAIVACVAAVSLLFMVAQGLTWAAQGFTPMHGGHMHVWHGYDFFSAITWLLFIHHLRARLGWRNTP